MWSIVRTMSAVEVRVAIRVAGDERPDLDSGGRLREGGEGRPALEVRAVGVSVEREEVVPRVDDVVAEDFGPQGAGAQIGQAPCCGWSWAAIRMGRMGPHDASGINTEHHPTFPLRECQAVSLDDAHRWRVRSCRRRLDQGPARLRRRGPVSASVGRSLIQLPLLLPRPAAGDPTGRGAPPARAEPRRDRPPRLAAAPISGRHSWTSAGPSRPNGAPSSGGWRRWTSAWR